MILLSVLLAREIVLDEAGGNDVDILIVSWVCEGCDTKSKLFRGQNDGRTPPKNAAKILKISDNSTDHEINSILLMCRRMHLNLQSVIRNY